MNHSAKKEHHEKARKKHKQEMQASAREAAKRGRSKMPVLFLVAGIVLIAALIVAASIR